MIIFPRHQIWHLSYNLVTPIEDQGCIAKRHIFKLKPQNKLSVLQDCGDIKIMNMLHDKIFVSVELTLNGHVTHLVVQGVFFIKKHGSAAAPNRGQGQNLMFIQVHAPLRAHKKQIP